jgi:hypothetical protein
MKTSTSDSISTISDQDIKPIMRSTRALFVAILSRALKDIFKPTCDDYDLCKRQALHWIEVNDPESFTSFVNICNYLKTKHTVVPLWSVRVWSVCEIWHVKVSLKKY